MEHSRNESMSATLSKSEEKLFLRKPEFAAKLLPVCTALKLAGFETAIIADIMHNLQAEDKLPSRFTIMNNRYLVYKQELIYDLHKSEAVAQQPDEPKRMAVTFWL